LAATGSFYRSDDPTNQQYESTDREIWAFNNNTLVQPNAGTVKCENNI